MKTIMCEKEQDDVISKTSMSKVNEMMIHESSSSSSSSSSIGEDSDLQEDDEVESSYNNENGSSSSSSSSSFDDAIQALEQALPIRFAFIFSISSHDLLSVLQFLLIIQG